jgi:hypothetical protein
MIRRAWLDGKAEGEYDPLNAMDDGGVVGALDVVQDEPDFYAEFWVKLRRRLDRKHSYSRPMRGEREALGPELAKESPPDKDRPCLRCEKPFRPKHRFNKLCDQCSGYVTFLDAPYVANW